MSRLSGHRPGITPGRTLAKDPGAKVRAWMFWIDGGVHGLFLILVVILLFRS